MALFGKKLFKPLYVIIVLTSVFLIFLGLRYQDYFRFYKEIQFVKSFWIETMRENGPTANWKSRLSNDAKKRDDWIFYGFKVWFIDFGSDPPSPQLLSFEHASNPIQSDNRADTSRVAVTFKYAGVSQRLHAVVRQTNTGLVLYPSLSLDNCSWSPDHNGDGNVDRMDVKLAQEAKRH